MSEEWRWNNEHPSGEFEPEKKADIAAQELSGAETDGLKENQEKAEEQSEELTEDQTGEGSTETVSEEATDLENKSEERKEEETYHWVNPEYQKRQQGVDGTDENTYQNTNYREKIGSDREANANTSQGYYGGSYHSDWKKRQMYNQEQAENKKPYETYNLSPENSEQKKKTRKKTKTGKRLLTTIALAVVFGVVAGSVMFGVNKAANYFWGDEDKKEETKQVSLVQMQQSHSSEEDENTGTSSSGINYSVTEVAANCMPSVVSITSASVTSVKNYFGGVQEYASESSGSGIIVGQNEMELLIATNNHVIDGAETVTVAFCDDSVYSAQKKGSASDADLAVIAVKLSDMTEETLEAIRIIKIGNSDNLQVGEQVVAIGNALGYGQSVTSGWVSAVNRSVEDSDGNIADSLIQTDAAINPGNSGGALLNMRGELIGINSAKASATEVEGMGYAISIAKAEPILNELMNIKTRYKVDAADASYIGVTCMTVESTVTQMYGIPTGAFIDSVEEGGPADKAGIQKGDVLVKFDGQTITGSTQLVSLLEYYEANEIVDVIVARSENGVYKEITLTVTLGRKSEMKQTNE